MIPSSAPIRFTSAIGGGLAPTHYDYVAAAGDDDYESDSTIDAFAMMDVGLHAEYRNWLLGAGAQGGAQGALGGEASRDVLGFFGGALHLGYGWW